jgi:hypothetical protein
MSRSVDRATEADIPALMVAAEKMHRKAGAPWPVTQSVSALLYAVRWQGPWQTIGVVRESGQVIGYLWASVKDNGVFWIEQIWSADSGTTKALVRWAEDEARALGCSEIAGIVWRAPEAWERKFGAVVTGWVISKGV